MKFCRIILYDLKTGTGRKPYFLLIAAVTWVLCTRAHAWYATWNTAGIGDYFIYCMAGIEPFQRASGEEFHFPISWLLFWGCAFFSTLSYPRRDLTSYGQQILLRMDRRILWWISKCVWVVLNSCLLFLIYVGVMMLFGLVNGVPFRFENVPALTLSLFLNYWDTMPVPKLFGPQLISLSCLLPLAFLVTVALLQLLLSLVIQPVFALFFTMSILIVSAFLNSPFLLGNYAMVLRSAQVIEDGVTLSCGVLFFSVITLAVFVIGCYVIKRINILPLEKT